MGKTMRKPVSTKAKSRHTIRLGRLLRSYRERMGFSMREFEKLTGIINSTICRIENGKAIDYETGKQIELEIGFNSND